MWRAFGFRCKLTNSFLEYLDPDMPSSEVTGTLEPSEGPTSGGLSTAHANLGHRSRRNVSALALGALVLACSPRVGGGADGAGTTSLANDIGVTPVSRLNRTQYDNTVRDLLQTEQHPAADGFPTDELVLGFDTIASALRVQPEHIEKYLAASDALIGELLARPATDPARAQYFTCDLNAGAQCLSTVVRNFASVAWRRPVSDAELAPYVRAVQAQRTLDLGLSVALRAVLSSANFLYRWELDADPDDAQPHLLNGNEVATRLSYALWGTLPDAELRRAAGSGELGTPEGILVQTRRLLDSEAGVTPLVDSFGAQWLNVNQVNVVTPDATQFPLFDGELRAAMIGETKAFLRLFLHDDLPASQLFQADFTFVNARLAEHYGITGITGDAFQRVPAGSQRGGLLRLGAFLTSTSNPTRTSPVKRGYFVLDRLLCSAPPPPPPAVNLNIDQGSGLENLSVRQRLAQHEQKGSSCFSCHRVMDAIGIGLENYDGIGAYRQADAFGPIDAATELPAASGATTPFDGASELSNLLADDERTLPCIVKKLLTFTLGREIQAAQEPMKVSIAESTKAHGGGLRAAIEAIVVSDLFRKRRAATAAEIAP